MVRIRLRRVGAKKQPHYRVVVANHSSPRDGSHIETIGHYNPRTQPETVNIKEDRALYWLSQGAQPSVVVRRMLEKQGTLARLSRLKAGEPLEALLAEYESGLAVEETAEPVVQPAAAAVALRQAQDVETLAGEIETLPEAETVTEADELPVDEG